MTLNRIISSFLIVCMVFVPNAPVVAQSASVSLQEPSFRYVVTAPEEAKITFSYRGREPLGPPEADDFFDDVGRDTAKVKSDACEGGGIVNALRCDVTEVIKQNHAETSEDAPQASDATRTTQNTEENGPVQAKLELTLTPEVTHNDDGQYTVKLKAKPDLKIWGQKPSDALKRKLETEALFGLPGDMAEWSATFTQKDLDNLANAGAGLHYDLNDQFKALSLFNIDGRLRLKLSQEKRFDPEIKAVILIDDQFGQSLEPGQTAQRDYRHPYFADGARAKGVNDRYLLVLGKYLPNPGEESVKSSDMHVTYSMLSKNQPGMNDLASTLTGMPRRADEDILYVKADLLSGVQPGAKELGLVNDTGSWDLGFIDRTGTLDFVREDSFPGGVHENTFYFGETIRVGVRADTPGVPVDGIEVEIIGIHVDKTTTPYTVTERKITTLPLSDTVVDELGQSDRLNDAGKNIALSEPFEITHAEERPFGPLTAADAAKFKVALRANEKLGATIRDRYTFLPKPLFTVANVANQPPPNSLWQTALNKVGSCKGVSGDPTNPNFPREPIMTLTNKIIFETWESRNITVRKGDQAALGLIRDELMPMIIDANRALVPYLGNGEDGEFKAQRYWSNAKRRPGIENTAFWRVRKATIEVVDKTDGKSIYRPSVQLFETLDLQTLLKRINTQYFGHLPPELQRKTNMKLVDLRDKVNAEIQRNLQEQHLQTIQAIGKAHGAGYCGTLDLLRVAGQRTDAAVASLLHTLMEQKNGKWVPDLEARRYVRTVFQLGQAYQAQVELDAVDSALASIALAATAAIVTAGASAYASAAVAGSGGTAALGATYLATAVDLADLAYFGRKSVIDYTQGEANYATQMGLSPVLAPDVVAAAEAGRQNPVLTAIGVLLPAGTLMSSLRSLRSLKNIDAGRTLIRSRNFNSIQDFTEAERIQIAAYYNSLKRQDASPVIGLYNQERRDLALLDNVISDTRRAAVRAEVRDIMRPRQVMPDNSSLAKMPEGAPGGMAQLDQAAPRGMPSGSDRGILDKSVLQADAGKVVQDTRPFGMLPKARRAFQEAVDDAGLAVRVRAANDTSLAQMRAGHPPKHVKLKSKTINDLDVELGAKPGSQGMVGYFEPKQPGELVLPPKPQSATPAQLAKWEEDAGAARTRHARLQSRYQQRLKEYADNAKDIGKLRERGLISVEDGVVVDRGLSNTRLNSKGELVYNRRGPEGGTGEGFTGDPDMWDIRHPDGRPISSDPTSPDYDEAAHIRKMQLQQRLDESVAKTQHGPHKDWVPVTERDIGIDRKIRESHNPGGEALLEFRPGEKLPRTSYEIDDEGKLIPPRDTSAPPPDADPASTVRASDEVDLEKTVKVGDEVDPDKTVKVGDDVDPEKTVKVGDDFDPDKTVKVGDEVDLDKTVKVGDDFDPDKTVKVGDDFDPDKTVKVGDSGDETIAVSPSASNATSQASARAPQGLPEGQVDLLERAPGEWLQERGLTRENLGELIEKSRRGDALTTKEMLDKIDFLRIARAGQ